jgi:pyrroloquinoline-quinone synthase
MTIGDRPLPFDEFVEVLRREGFQRYHHQHPFHRLMNEGRLTPGQMRAWLVQRFYYQSVIPLKDAAILANCPVREVRRVWIRRILDHDGTADKPGGIEAWLRFGEAMGLRREDILQASVLPGVRLAGDAYVTFCKTHSWLEGVASSLTTMFAPSLHEERLAAFRRYYPWIRPDGLAYFEWRLQAGRRVSRASSRPRGAVPDGPGPPTGVGCNVTSPAGNTVDGGSPRRSLRSSSGNLERP